MARVEVIIGLERRRRFTPVGMARRVPRFPRSRLNLQETFACGYRPRSERGWRRRWPRGISIMSRASL